MNFWGWVCDSAMESKFDGVVDIENSSEEEIKMESKFDGVVVNVGGESHKERVARMGAEVVQMGGPDGGVLRNFGEPENMSRFQKFKRAAGEWFWPRGAANKIFRLATTTAEVVGTGIVVTAGALAATQDPSYAIFAINGAEIAGIAIGAEILRAGARRVINKYRAGPATIGADNTIVNVRESGRGNSNDIASDGVALDDGTPEYKPSYQGRRSSIDSEHGVGDPQVHPFSPSTTGVAKNPLGVPDGGDQEIDEKDARNKKSDRVSGAVRVSTPNPLAVSRGNSNNELIREMFGVSRLGSDESDRGRE